MQDTFSGSGARRYRAAVMHLIREMDDQIRHCLPVTDMIRRVDSRRARGLVDQHIGDTR